MILLQRFVIIGSNFHKDLDSLRFADGLRNALPRVVAGRRGAGCALLLQRGHLGVRAGLRLVREVTLAHHQVE